MGRGTRLSEFERGKIAAYRSDGKSISATARELHRSRKVVSNYLKDPEGYGTKKSKGRPRALSSRDERLVGRTASNRQISVSDIKEITGTQASRSTINRYLNRNPSLKYKKMDRKPPLTPQHKSDRLEFAKEHMTWDKEWETVIFTDEKKFNLDGPDGWSFYWHDLRKEPRVFSKRAFGGGGVMIWGAFSARGKVNLVFINGTMKGEDYQKLLAIHLLPVGPALGGRHWRLQQDNASPHASNPTMDWFKLNRVRVLNWPARSPDINPIENLWGILARKVYAHGTQFLNVKDLKNAILTAWEEIPAKTLRELVRSMKDRVFQVINRNGGTTKY